MATSRYWDLFECRWVEYHGQEAAVATLPAPRETESDDVAEGAPAS